MVLFLVCVPLTSQAATNDELLTACDKALYAKVNEVNLCNLGIKYRDEDRLEYKKENAQLRESNQAWYSNPFTFAALGIIAGAFIGARATR